jgi:hypothetical protein
MRDRVNERYGYLTVVEFDEIRNGRYFWKCKCDCGSLTIVEVGRLLSGHTQSCGCYQKKQAAKAKTKHGETHRNEQGKIVTSRLYNIWTDIRARCRNVNDSHYIYYGARGIGVCSYWDDFAVFKKWAIDHGYKDNLLIDRINNDGNYEPSNCRWTNSTVQNNNRSNTIMIEYHSIKSLFKIGAENLSLIAG